MPWRRHWRTVTRPNGEPNVREQVMGLGGIFRWTAVISLLVTIAGAMLRDRISIERRLTMRAELTEEAKAELTASIAKAISENNRDYVSYREWNQRNDDLDRRLTDFFASTERRLVFIDQHQRHLLGIAEQLPGAREDDK